MKIEEGRFYTNKTWDFLIPCLRAYGDVFISKFNSIFKLAVGIHDTKFKNLDKSKNIFVLCDKSYEPTTFNEFLDFTKTQKYYVSSYCPDNNSNRVMVVIKIPSVFENAYDNFILGKYSLMFSKEEIDVLFPFETQESRRKILTKDERCKDDFIKKINIEFDLELDLKDFNENFKEYEFPPKKEEEIFNNQEEKGFINSL